VTLVCALAVMAVPALAAEFHSSSPGKTRGKAFEETPQEFRFGALKINCAKAVASGEMLTTASPTFFTSVKYRGCLTEAKIGPNPIFLKTIFKTPVSYEYHHNGFAELGGENENEVALTAPTSVEIRINSIQCVIELPVQTVPALAEKKPNGTYSAVSYETEEVPNAHKKAFPSGFQKKLRIENGLTSVKYAFVAGQCEEFEHPEGSGGKIKGSILEERVGADLWFE
jgi:hypothetical protein